MDPIADLLVRIKNAQAAGREATEAPFSKVKFAIAKILEKEGFIVKVEKKGIKSKEKLEIKLKYNQGIAAIQDLKRISRPGQRIYVNAQKLKLVKQGYGLAIISTSHGLMTDREAKKKKLGGEVLCEVW
jgi:small subunit ribosomal protein S8